MFLIPPVARSQSIHVASVSQRGFTMLEIMITLVVFAIGMLGMAGMQIIAKKNNFEAAQRTAATSLAYDIIERMRANPTQLVEYAGDSTTPPAALGGASLGSSAPTPNCASASCTPFQLSQYDLWEWEQGLDGAAELSNGESAGGLSLPTACISTTVASGATDRSGLYAVAIVWRGASRVADPYQGVNATAPESCGRGSGKYNDEDGNVDVHRRVLVVRTYISTR